MKVQGCAVEGCGYLHHRAGFCLSHYEARPRRGTSADVAGYVKKVVDAAPPLTAAQRDKLSLIFADVRHRHGH